MGLKVGLLLFAVLVAVGAIGCSSGRAAPVASGESLGDQLVVLPALTELVVGQHRLTFGLFNTEGEELTAAQVPVQLYHLQGERDIAKGQYHATYYRLEVEAPHVHEGGEVHLHKEVRGFYLVQDATFDAPGVWRTEVTLSVQTSQVRKGSLAVQVVERPSTPTIGSLVPATQHSTVQDVANLAELTTRTPPEPRFHQISIAQALQTHRPFVVTFATPAFCVSRMCGPVLEVVRSVALGVGDSVAFIQIEPYDLGLARREGKLELVPASKEWGLQTEPWVFVVDAQGRLAAKFEGLLTAQELLAAVQKVSG